MTRLRFQRYYCELVKDFYEVTNSFLRISGKDIFLKLIMMVVNFLIYASALKLIGPVFAVIHAGSLLVMNVFKAGGVFNAISEGGGALGFIKKNLVTRLSLSFVWLICFSFIFGVDVFYISLLGIPFALIWLAAYDKHIAGVRTGGVLLSAMPIALSGLLFILIERSTFGQIEMKAPDATWMFILASMLLVAFYLLREQFGNTVAELLNANISPVLIAYIVSLNLGEAAWLYLIYFKVAEALSQLLVFIFTAARKKEYSVINITKHMPFIFITTLIFIAFTYKAFEYPVVFFVCLWPLYHTLYLWNFLRYHNRWAVYYVAFSFLILSIGVQFSEGILTCILMMHIAVSILAKYFFVKNLENGLRSNF